MQSSAQKTVSLLKKKGLGAKGEFMKMHLAVYPYEVEFLNNVNHPTAFYFQKNYQIIGELSQTIPPNQKSTKLPITNIKNLIFFKLYNANNVVYKWSLYRKQVNDQEQFLDSCTLNLKEIVTNFIGPQKTSLLLSQSQSSIYDIGLQHKQMRLKFPKVGVILIFLLLVAGDEKDIKQHIQRHFINKEEYDPVLESLPHPTMLKTESGNLEASSNMKNKSSTQSLYKIKSSDNVLNSSESLTQKLKSSLNDHSKHKQQAKKPENTDNLENLIMSFSENGNITSPIQDHQLQQEPKIQSKQNQLKEEIFKEDYNPPKESKVSKKQEKERDERDYSMLKLESDQGRLRQEPIDKKLQLEELEAIEEEEKLSRECTINQTNISPIKKRQAKSTKSHASISNQSQKDQPLKLQISPPSSSKINLKKIGLVFLFSIFLFVVAATLSKTIHKKKHVQKHRRNK